MGSFLPWEVEPVSVGESRGHVTLQGVARSAGVSLATASRVLNGTTKVREDLRQRVLDAADRLGYIPNAHAQALASSSSRVVGAICHDVSDPYFAAIAGGVMRAAAERGLLVMLASTFRDPEREVAYVSMLRAQRARAILLIGSGFEDRGWERSMSAELDPYVRSGGRVAVVSRHRSLKVDAVLPENRAGAAALARAMLDLGHREFAVLSGPPTLTTVADRLTGFREALAEAGVDLPDSRIIEGAFTRDGGHAAAHALLARHALAATPSDTSHHNPAANPSAGASEEPRGAAGSVAVRPGGVTCVFATTDVMAIGAMAAFREAGLRVPEDVSLAGFDDIPIVADLTPALTTVRLPLADMGERVMNLVLRDRAPGSRSRVERIAGEVILRASTALLHP